MSGRDVELGYLARAALPASRAGVRPPGVVLVHDVWGLADHPRDLADRLAREGFDVLAIDLYRRERAAAKGPLAIEDPGAWIRELSDPRVLSDLEQAARWLATREPDAPVPVGVIGFCMGGMYALLAACRCPGFAAAVSFYGLLSHERGLLAGDLDPAKKPESPLAAASQLHCPLLAFFGAEDELVHLDDVCELEVRLAAAARGAGEGPHGVRVEVVVVAGAGHAFMNDTRADAFRAEAAGRAWERSVAFLRARLAAEPLR